MEISSAENEIEGVGEEVASGFTFWEDKELVFLLVLSGFLVLQLLRARGPFDILKWLFLTVVLNSLGFFVLCYLDQRPIHLEAVKTFERCQHFGIMDKMTQQVLMECLNSKKMLEKGLLRNTLGEFFGDLQTFLKDLAGLDMGGGFFFWCCIPVALALVVAFISRVNRPSGPRKVVESRHIFDDPLF